MRAEIRGVLKGGLPGAAVSTSLWVMDLMLTSTLRFAGADDPAAQERVVNFAFRSIVALEVKLFFVFASFGFVLGVMTVSARSWLSKNRKKSDRADWALAALVTLVAHVLTLLGMVARYPQLYADRWWLGGGFLATLQRVVTHVIGPIVFDFLFIGLMLALLIGTILRVFRDLNPAFARRHFRWMALAIGLSAVVYVGLPDRSPRPPDDAPPNVLILCLDSLRTDRLESADVMPFSSSLIPAGSLHRFAFTPIARTYPSWVSLLTGTEPRQHAVRTMFPSREVRRDIGRTFISTLRDNGYRTFVVSDFAGDIFHGFNAGFETVDTPELNVDTLAQSTVFNAHNWALPLLRYRFLRNLFPIWRNQPSIADPEWLARDALDHIRRAKDRPFAGVVFFSTAHFPYTPPYPYYRINAKSYRGPYLYHVPPDQAGRDMSPDDVAQVRALYDAALISVDHAIQRIFSELEERELANRTIVVITGDHGEELYDLPGIAGHGDFVDFTDSQAVPIFLTGPGVTAGEISNRQARLYDLGATILDLVKCDGPASSPRSFGEGISLLESGIPRPICVETGIWFYPTLPAALRDKRLSYPGIAELLTVDETSRELVLHSNMEGIVETAKQRGVILGNRLWRERLTPHGLDSGLTELPGVDDEADGNDLHKLFDERCVETDTQLRRFFGAVVFQKDSQDK